MAMYIAASPLISVQSQTEDNESIEANVKKKCLEQGVAEHSLCPFRLQWSFGLNPEVPAINLTTENRTLLAYACSHVAVIYDYKSRKMLPLLDHRNAVRTLSTSRDGKWLLTADYEDDCSVVVWDVEKGVPVCTLFNPHGSENMTAARISPDAKQIITVGNEKCQNVHFWLWTHGRDKPHASVSLTDTTSERVKEIVFNDENPKQFALTTNYHVLFLTWNDQALSCDCPKIVTKSRHIGIFNGSCYVPKVQQIFTATANGYILVWGNISYEETRTIEDPNYQTKRHIKTVNLQKDNITVIIDNEGMLVTGNSNGRITFYDYQLRILYWCQSCDLDSIRWISFDLRSNLLAPTFDGDISEKCVSQDNDGTKTALAKFNIKVEHIPRTYRDNEFIDKKTSKIKSSYLPTDATRQRSPFNVRNFLVGSATGVIALIEIAKQQCHFVFSHPVATAVSMDTHPESNYVVVGDAHGTMHLYNYEDCILTTSKSAPPLPDFRQILEKQVADENIIYVTCPQSHESLKAVTALKFSPRCDMLVCGLENGAIWILHHITLDPIDETPYKHSSAAVNKIVFARCAKYMAYADDALTVVVFKRNDTAASKERNVWNLIGKYHSHYLPIRDILFGPDVSNSDVPRFFSLGEDRDLVEYDLKHSGPYPIPGLQILRIDPIEQSAIPFCVAWYPASGTEKFLVTSNSEYKYKIFNDVTKSICGTYLGPTFGKPVQHVQVLTNKLVDNDNNYMVFATDREIGLQLLPLDGNPYKIVGMMGHPQKITGISTGKNWQVLFTTGYNDPCVLMWNIRLRSVDIMARLGGEGFTPFHCLIKGGRKGWLLNELKDLFYYAQISRQGENTTAARIVSDTVVVEQIADLMRAIGYYPTNKEIENITTEVCYKHYVETSKIVEEITFEEFVRLYLNHRPAFGLRARQIKEAFHTFVEEISASVEVPTLTREQFMDVLLGGAISGTLIEDNEPLSLQEACTYLKLLVSPDEETIELRQSRPSERSASFNFRFLPSRISYNDFAMNIMGVELLKETRDN